jgi:hypothetical protein
MTLRLCRIHRRRILLECSFATPDNLQTGDESVQSEDPSARLLIVVLYQILKSETHEVLRGHEAV